MDKLIMSFNSCFRNKNVVITGHTGFKGAWLTTWLVEMGAHVTGISKDIPSQPALFEVLNLDKKITHHVADICSKEKVIEIINQSQPDFLFHLAAQPIVSASYREPVETFLTNVMGTTHILEALRSLKKPCKAVMITSDKCYDNVEWIWGYREHDALGGKDPYSASKGAAELAIKTYYHAYFSKSDSPIKIVSVRAGNVIGGGDWAINRIVPDCMRAWSVGQQVKLRNPDSTRPWQHVLEPLSGYLRAAQVLEESKYNISGEPFNFGPNADQNHTVLELIQKLSEYWGDGQSERYHVERETQFHEAGLLKLNCDKALSYLQWKPVLNFKETAEYTASWYNNYYNKKDVNHYDFTVRQIRQYIEKGKQQNIVWYD